jgi:hypothetical protein
VAIEGTASPTTTLHHRRRSLTHGVPYTRVADVASPVTVCVQLVGVALEPAVVDDIQMSVAIVVKVARVADAVVVGVLLRAIADDLAVVAAGADAVAVAVQLRRVRHVFAIVDDVENALRITHSEQEASAV